MQIILYKVNRLIIAHYIVILGNILFIKYTLTKTLNKFDPYVILFLYYLGLLFYTIKLSKPYPSQK